ncbi:hypothetical protein [Urechidicola croceus]|uniref:Uncharacterized protein n=1 Tax=Urechidicola croceus TaxID=1850246 RepID=A0A1D8PB26_9FLAO|nr:hypothetical protein [Urechidicola croceus]AOW21780.1 hypothetical protein LPB138_14315 [Urechidicola croceus]
MSCVNDVDFDQVDDIEINTVHRASLVYFTTNNESFLDVLGNQVLTISDTTTLPIFQGPYTENYLVRADFNYNITNTFNRDFTIQYEFLSEDYMRTWLFDPIEVPSNTVDYEITQSITEDNIQQVIESNRVVINIILEPTNEPTNTNPELSLQSAATFYYQVTTTDE